MYNEFRTDEELGRRLSYRQELCLEARADQRFKRVTSRTLDNMKVAELEELIANGKSSKETIKRLRKIRPLRPKLRYRFRGYLRWLLS